MWRTVAVAVAVAVVVAVAAAVVGPTPPLDRRGVGTYASGWWIESV